MRKLYKSLAVFLSVIVCASVVSPAGRADGRTDEEPVAIVRYVDGGEVYNDPVYDLETALDNSVVGDTYYLLKNVSLSRSVEIKSNVELVIPTSSDYDGDTPTGNNIKQYNPENVTPYVTLTVPAGVTLTVSGTLLVAGNQQGAVPKAGYLTGPHGAVKLEGTMDVKSTGTVYARGSIFGGGTANINGGTVYERFEIADWRGGNASLDAYTLHIVYPFELYELGGLDVTSNFDGSSTLIGQSFIYSDRLEKGATSLVQMLGSTGLITFSDTAAHVTFTHSNGISTAEVYGNVETGNITVYVDSAFGIDFPLTSTHGVGPIGYKQNVVLKSGSVFTVNNNLKVLPDSTFTVESGATLDAKSNLYFYTVSGYSSTYNYAGWNGTSDAELYVEGGTVTGTIGSTSDTFSNIHGITLVKGRDATVREVTQSGGATSVRTAYVTFYTGTPATAE